MFDVKTITNWAKQKEYKLLFTKSYDSCLNMIDVFETMQELSHTINSINGTLELDQHINFNNSKRIATVHGEGVFLQQRK